MHVDFLLIGQGICGTFLSWYLHKAGYSFLIIDDPQPGTASKVAAGIINPVTGRRMVKTWLIDEVMPFALDAYQQLEKTLQVKTIEQKNSIDFFPTPQMKEAFLKRYQEDAQYLSVPPDSEQWKDFFSYDFGYGMIAPCYLVNLPALLPAYRQWIQSQNFLLEDVFNVDQLQVNAGKIIYKEIAATAVIFCDGIASFQNPFFTNLPFAPNKGEVLWVEIKDLPAGNIYKRGINLVPWSDTVFWAGSSYEWEFEHDQPTSLFRERTLATLQYWLKVPVQLLDHRASIRPATIERRPFIGFHPLHNSVGIFNGMGTKGCSLAPYFAEQFVKHIQHQQPLYAEADIKRFKGILMRRQ